MQIEVDSISTNTKIERGRAYVDYPADDGLTLLSKSIGIRLTIEDTASFSIKRVS